MATSPPAAPAAPVHGGHDDKGGARRNDGDGVGDGDADNFFCRSLDAASAYGGLAAHTAFIGDNVADDGGIATDTSGGATIRRGTYRELAARHVSIDDEAGGTAAGGTDNLTGGVAAGTAGRFERVRVRRRPSSSSDQNEENEDEDEVAMLLTTGETAVRPRQQQQQQQQQQGRHWEMDSFFSRSMADDDDAADNGGAFSLQNGAGAVGGGRPSAGVDDAKQNDLGLIGIGNEQKAELRQRRRRQQSPSPPLITTASQSIADANDNSGPAPKATTSLPRRGSGIFSRSSAKSDPTTASASKSSLSSAFFTRSVRSMVESFTSPLASTVAGKRRSITGSRRGSVNSATSSDAEPNIPAATATTASASAPDAALPMRQAVIPTPPRNSTSITGNEEDNPMMVTPKLTRRKGDIDKDEVSAAVPPPNLDPNDQNDNGNEGDDPLRTPRADNVSNYADQFSTSPSSYLLSSPDRIRPIRRVASAATGVASAATVGLKQSIHSVSQSPAVSKAVQFGKNRSSAIIQRRRARRAAAIKARLARIERLKAEGKYSPIIIAADHPLKIAWDVLTIVLTVLSALRTHQSIRDRTYEQSPFVVFTEFWFILDILLNFFCEHKTSTGEIIRDGKAVWARYLTTWFVIDVLSVVPWERIYVKPIVEQQKRRNFFTKTFFRSKAVVRVTRILRGRHVKLFGRVARQTKGVGVGGQRLLRLIIKYVPKYILFFKNMRSVLVIRTLRQVHFLRKLWKTFVVSIRREPLVVLRRPGMVFAAASAEWTDEEDWDDDDLDEAESNSLLGSEGQSVDYEDDLDADELEDIHGDGHQSGIFIDDDDMPREKAAGGRMLLPHLENNIDEPSLPQPQRIRAVSEGLVQTKTSSASTNGATGLRFRRGSSKEQELDEVDSLFS